jgi:hypothetical protein
VLAASAAAALMICTHAAMAGRCPSQPASTPVQDEHWCSSPLLARAGIPLRDIVASCAAGHLSGHALLDLNYMEDSGGCTAAGMLAASSCPPPPLLSPDDTSERQLHSTAPWQGGRRLSSDEGEHNHTIVVGA